jgi:twinkle protein
MATLVDYGIEIPYNAAGEVRVLCPQCSAGRKKRGERCLAVNVDKGAWQCKHCGWSGGVKDGADDYGSPAPTKARTYTRPDYTPGDVDALDAKALHWLTVDRAIPEAVVRRNRLESRRVFMPQAEKVVSAIAFPYFRAGAVVNVKYRDGAKHFRMEKDAELCLYGLDDIDPARPLVWVEGELDKLSCEAVGFGSCLSLPNGAPPVDAKNLTNHFAPLGAAMARLESIGDHIIAVDNDAPGRNLQDELVRRLGVDRCRLAVWPEGCKDANDVLTKHGPERLAACLNAAAPVPVAGLFTPLDLADRLNDLYDNGMAGGVAPSNAAIADLYRVKTGTLTVVTGIPGDGKTTWLDWLLVDLMRTHGWRFAVCSPENQPLQRHLSRMLQLVVGKPFTAGEHPRMTARERDEANAWIEDYVTFVLPTEDDTQGCTLDRILNLAKIAIRRRGATGVVIDPWNDLEHSRPAGLREDEYLGQSLIKIKRFARAHNVHVWLVAHPRTLQKVERDGEAVYPVPTLYDISGGSMWRNKADAGIVVYRPSKDEGAPTQIYVQKIRFQPESGKLGMAELYYDKLTGRYGNVPITHRYDSRDPWEDDE